MVRAVSLTQGANSAGPAPREAIAQQIASAIGPSGRNDEYLYGLVKALQEVGALMQSMLQTLLSCLHVV